MQKIIGALVVTAAILTAGVSCGGARNGTAAGDGTASSETAGAPNGVTAASVNDESANGSVADNAAASVPEFNADSAYVYLKRQVDFGPRVPNSVAHRKTGEMLVAELKRSGAQVHEQRFDATAFDGTVLHSRNIFARFNPEKETGRLLLLAHYDTRPWADQDPDESKRKQPIDGANDGASGVAVLLETARQLAIKNPGCGIDILLVDAEDYGTDNREDSWAMGAKYFADHMDAKGWRPAKAILLDMVGGRNARFPYEYFSQQAAPELNAQFRQAAGAAGYASYFPQTMGGAVTDDHVKLIEQGVPAIDIIDYDPRQGFNPTWHTVSDNIGNIDKATLKAVGQSLLQFIYK